MPTGPLNMYRRVQSSVISDPLLISSVIGDQLLISSIQVTSASVSLVASSAIAVMIALPRNGGLSSPYRRIIFGLSVSDMCQSIGFLAGPFSVPSDANPWAIGNNGTCQANAFILALGSAATPMYICALCFYYLCKLKLRMTDADFCSRYEQKIHIFISLFNLTVPVLALALETFHPALHGSFCHFALSPRGCRYIPDVVGECDPAIKDRVDILHLIISVVIPFICLLIVVVVMTMLYCHAIAWKRMFRAEVPPATTSSLRQGASNIETEEENENSANDVPPHSGPRETVQRLSRLYRRESLIQATFYVSSFCLVYIPSLTIYVQLLLHKPVPLNLGRFGIVIYPLGGLFYILTYTRPKVASLRRKHPEYSRLLALWLVLKAGGEIPEENDSGSSLCCCSFPRKEDENEEQSSPMEDPPQSFVVDFESAQTPSYDYSERLSSTDISEKRKHARRAEGYRFYNIPISGKTSSGASTPDTRQLCLDNCPNISSGVNGSHMSFSAQEEISGFSNIASSGLDAVTEEHSGEYSDDIESSAVISDRSEGPDGCTSRERRFKRTADIDTGDGD